MTRILVVDDEPSILRSLTIALAASDYQVDVAATGKQAVAKAAGANFDAIILDLGLPDFNGLEVIRQVRELSHRVPILVLSAWQEIDTRVEALNLGADDYIPKPFAMPELLARLRVALRHSSRETRALPEAQGTIERGPLAIDPDQRVAALEGCEVELTRTQFDTLLFLAQHPNRVLTHGAITDAVWGADAEVDPQNLRVVISQLRKRIEPTDSPVKFIRTELGVGYRFQVTSVPDTERP